MLYGASQHLSSSLTLIVGVFIHKHIISPVPQSVISPFNNVSKQLRYPCGLELIKVVGPCRNVCAGSDL